MNVEKEPTKKFWKLTPEEVADLFNTDLNKGLSPDQVEKNLRTYGYNQLQEIPGRSPLVVFLDQFKSFLIWVLLVAAVVSGFLGEWIDSLAIIGIVILNAILG
ncbi:MAG: cation-transporting P-type ATPase, partial [Candidatus Saccharicenans sp.]